MENTARRVSSSSKNSDDSLPPASPSENVESSPCDGVFSRKGICVHAGFEEGEDSYPIPFSDFLSYMKYVREVQNTLGIIVKLDYCFYYDKGFVCKIPYNDYREGLRKGKRIVKRTGSNPIFASSEGELDYVQSLTPKKSPKIEWLQEFEELGYDFSKFGEYEIRMIDYDELQDYHAKKSELVFIDAYCSRIKPPAKFLELLDILGIDRKLADGHLAGFRRVVDVDGAGVLYPVVFANEYNSWNSWGTIRASASRLVHNILDFANSFKGELNEHLGERIYLICLDLTFPSGFSELLLIDKPLNVIVIAEKCLNEFFEYLSSGYLGGGRLAVWYNTHLWKTECPTHPHLHFHTNLLNVVNKGTKQKPDFRFFPFWISEDFLKKLWKKVLEQNGIKVVDVNGNDCLPDLKIGFIEVCEENVPKMLHRVKYASRRAICDLWNYFYDGGEIENPEFCRILINYINPRKLIGFSHYLGVFGFGAKPKHHCPVCNRPACRGEYVNAQDVFKKIVFEGVPVVFWDPKVKKWKIFEFKISERYKKEDFK